MVPQLAQTQVNQMVALVVVVVPIRLVEAYEVVVGAAFLLKHNVGWLKMRSTAVLEVVERGRWMVLHRRHLDETIAFNPVFSFQSSSLCSVSCYPTSPLSLPYVLIEEAN